MISKDLEAKIVLLFKNEKLPIGTVANALGIHHSVVRCVLRQNPETADSPTRTKLIDPYIPFLQEQMERYPDLKASRLFQMAVERGYEGKSDHFRFLMQKLRPEKKYEAFTRITVLEGQQAQVDWACFGKMKVGKTERPLYAFLMVLSWSRQIFLKYFMSMEMSCFLQGHVDAFEFFAGVPRELLHDNLKSAVIERHESLIKFNENYLNFATHYRFLPRACNVRRGNEKGRVERAVRYVRDNFFAGREFHNLQDLNEQAMAWCTGIAGARSCLAEPLFTVKEAFEHEKPKLLRLPYDSYPIYTRELVKVGKTHYAKFDKNDYSVPGEYVRKQLEIQASPSHVEFLYRNKVIANHVRNWGKGECILIPQHADDILKYKSKLLYSRTVENLFILLPSARPFLENIATQGGNLGLTAQNLHACLNDYGIELMTEAIEIVIKKVKFSIVDIRLAAEKLQSQKGKKIPLALSPISESKANQLSIIKPNLAKYDILGE